MKSIQPAFLAIALLCSVESAKAVLIQSIPGPVVGSGGGSGNTIVNTSSDTGNWIDAMNASTSATYYFGWDWTVENNAGENGAGGFFGGVSFYNTNNVQVFLVGNHWFDTTITAGSDSGYAGTSIPYSVGTPIRLVLEVTKSNSVTFGDWKLWVNPGTGSFATPDTLGLSVSFGGLSSLQSRGGNSTGQASVANFVVGTTFADVVPEPTAAALFALGLGFAAARRRRSQVG
jgi:hypothetical protein